MSVTRVIIVDDEPIHLNRLKIILEGEADFSVAGAFQSAEEAMPAINPSRCDLLLTDIQMPGAGGLALISDTRQKFPDLKIIALTAMEDIETVVAALKEGAIGYLLKTESSARLCDRLREGLQGGAALSPKIAMTLIGQFQSGAAAQAGEPLTKKERDILFHAEQGLTYKETASRLGMSVHTVHHHVKNIFEKLNAHTKTEALMVARKRGLI